MRLFYIDESGCLGMLPTATSNIQPVFVISGLIIEQTRLQDFTFEFLKLKQRFYPGLISPNRDFLDSITVEIKGSDLRKQIRSNSRQERRHAFGFMEKVLVLLESFNAKILGKIYIKAIGANVKPAAVYTSSVQSLASHFQHYLHGINDEGLMILDSRTKGANTVVSHSVFTQKFKNSGDAYGNMLEMPIFGHSDNHAGIQVADVLCSGFLFPMSTYAYCLGKVNNIHVHTHYSKVREKFGLRIRNLQYRYIDHPGRWRGGLTVSDGLSQQSGSLLFTPTRY